MKLRPFELGLIVTFATLAIIALVVVKTADTGSTTQEADPQNIGEVQIWGTLSPTSITSVLGDLIEENKFYSSISYKHYHPDEFDKVLLRALADGRGPDLMLISQEKLVEMRRRIQPFSYEAFPLPDIRNKYIDGVEVFALPDGLYGFPIAVDPLMMYWNRSILSADNYLEPPLTWEALSNDYLLTLIKRSFDRTISRSVVAMGEYENVRNSFGVLSALIIQGGSDLVTLNSNNEYLVQLQTVPGSNNDPLRAAADFYTRFSQPSNSLYSWNRAFSDDRTEFIAEDLALYFGYASEGREIEEKNPNLNFDIAEVPQGANTDKRSTYGKFYSLTLLKSADNVSGAQKVMQVLASDSIAEQIALRAGMVPVHRSLVSQGSNDIYGRLAYKSAANAVGWLNPELSETNDIFNQMVKDINENRSDPKRAAGDTSLRIRNILEDY